ncbi:hypothetical protein BJF79_44180 [Actinomadura sp. CNU-125]|uniref:NlpC/P60 family protein n=1 Tax=Actinomadura sp. CNU-125 TaxID=1904961 RepID=UPI00095AEB18|nr:NlpC/P60 family protein [Actinomadura sp. CNU-125]OLT25488.1 hypothetical protein BJF79_44180 [Actinomadura sp. CNU-125]
MPEGTPGTGGGRPGNPTGPGGALSKGGPTKPQGDTLGEKVDDLKEQAGRAAGEAAYQSTKGALAAAGVPPALTDLARKGLNNRLGRRMVGNPILRRFLPKGVEDGFWGGGDSGDKGGKGGAGGKDRTGAAEASGAGNGSGSGEFKTVMGKAAPFLALVLVPLLALMGFGGAHLATGDDEDQPDGTSDARVAEYLPGDWQRVLQDAARRASEGQPDHAKVPWTVLAGVVKTQTDFARYSPYDNIDRDPGREAAEFPAGGGGADGGAVEVGDTSGAGPGPVRGVGGPGSAATVPGSGGHPAPPDGDLAHQLGWFLWALRMHESNGDYTRRAGTSESDACGAYQYISSTWANYGGYRSACDAPPSIQDRRATRDVLDRWNAYGTWQQVAVAHFYPAWANSPEKWDRCPDACSFNPEVWSYVDDIMTRMRQAAEQSPAGAPALRPASSGGGSGPGSPSGGAPGVVADGCRVGNPDPGIGGEGSQGVGPYLVTPGAADDMANMGLDPQNPCDSSLYAARRLAAAARTVHADPGNPRWTPNGSSEDQENARDLWSATIEASGVFVHRDADPDAPCEVPPPDDPDEPRSIGFEIISIWRCEIVRMPELHLVIDGERVDDTGTGSDTGAGEGAAEFEYTVEEDRGAATEILVNEALSVSYGAGRWRTGGCDDTSDRRQGVFRMTRQEADAAGVDDRCDVDANIRGAARLVLAVEKVPPRERPADLGAFQPMAGGWQALGVAMGDDLRLFSLVGPGRRFTPTDECGRVMTRFLTDVSPHAAEFAALEDPPTERAVRDRWQPKMAALLEANGLREPSADPACVVGSWAPGFNGALAQHATGLAARYDLDERVLGGLADYYQGRENANEAARPVAGADTLVVPRLAPRPLQEIGAPIEPDATQAWNRIGSTDGVTVPLARRAVEYAWFFGGVIAPFDSAGELIGSLAEEREDPSGGGGPAQVEVGPDGCPTQAPPKTLRQGAAEIGVHRLCVDSVAQARTPEAAKAIKWALTNLGLPYCMCVPQRNWDEYADCSSFVSRAYRSAVPKLYKGNAPTTDTLRAVPWMRQIPLSEAKPGDLVEPNPGHVAMQLANGYKVHTNTTKDVSRVERAYSSVYWAGWFDPSKT